MAYTQVEICNLALDRIDAQNITALDDGTASAVVVNRHFDEALKHCLSQGYWRFALEQDASPSRIEVDGAATLSDNDQFYQYTLPANFQRLYRLYPHYSHLKYHIREGVLQAEWSITGMAYQNNDLLTPANWASFDENSNMPFVDYLCDELASRIASRLNRAVVDEMRSKALRSRLHALSSLAMNDSPEKIQTNYLENVFQGGGDIFDTLTVNMPT